ncbi:MAG: hypothetical protein J1E97_03025 [Muribaculaceae bacterium]|nr:hypothetical protein [Muribaculaceae bacterium]
MISRNEPAKLKLTALLTEKSGYEVNHPHAAKRLQSDIESATGERLSVNTIKRITGVLDYDGQLRGSTLEIVARYLGYQSFRELEAYLDGASSDFLLPPNGIDLAALQSGTRIEISWAPDREIRLRHLSQGRYAVEEAVNSKIKRGDIMTLGVAGVGLPLIATDIERAGSSLGPFTAAQESGVTAVRIL